jgi:hypothetical protein
MKKKSASQSAFFNLRVLIGLFVFLAGVFLALVSFGTFSSVFAQNDMTRQEMVALHEALAPADFVPPACVPGSEMFTDVPASNPYCPWIEELSRRGITAGCAPGLFCPFASVTRQQVAVFLIKTLEGARGAKDRFAVVSGTDGSLFRGRGVVSSAKLGTGEYQVIFHTDVTQCAYIGTVGMPTIKATDGFLTTALKAGTTDGVFVETFDATGAVADRNFHLEVVCP